MEYVVYQITNRINGKFYIGKATLARWNDGYMGSGKVIRLAVAKYGKAGFYRAILHQTPSEQEAFDKEEAIVDPKHPLSYNMQKGGRGGATGRIITDETRAKLRGYRPTKETRAKLRMSMKGRKLRPEHREKVLNYWKEWKAKHPNGSTEAERRAERIKKHKTAISQNP